MKDQEVVVAQHPFCDFEDCRNVATKHHGFTLIFKNEGQSYTVWTRVFVCEDHSPLTGNVLKEATRGH